MHLIGRIFKQKNDANIYPPQDAKTASHTTK
nr:MAG TPA: hypothetical protein [Caudoviricetes sp.]